MKTSWILKFILGAHALSVTFHINTAAKLLKLTAAMREAASRGATIFEIPYFLVGGDVTWDAIAKAAELAGIKELAFCHCWLFDAEGKSLMGDPLGDAEDRRRADETMGKILEAVEIVRENEHIKVRFIDGPTWGGIGKDYTLPSEQIRERMLSFLRTAGDKCAAANLILAVEFLRPGEGRVIRGTKEMVSILEEVNHGAVLAHYDAYHSLMHDENVAEMIRYARKWIAYLHLHGDHRIAPGAPGDLQNWKEIILACKEIDSGINNIPVICEPFAVETVDECPPLGMDLPPAPPLPEYLDIAYPTFIKAGLPIAKAT